MAVNFKIVQLRGKHGVHFNLDGDFDGTSAHELINALRACTRSGDKVFIHTGGLKEIHPFGRIVLQRNLSGLRGRYANLVFVGNRGHQLADPWVQ